MVEEVKELGAKIAKDSNEQFWLETKEKIIESIEAMKRNAKINEVMLKLCEKELEKFG